MRETEIMSVTIGNISSAISRADFNTARPFLACYNMSYVYKYTILNGFNFWALGKINFVSGLRFTWSCVNSP